MKGDISRKTLEVLKDAAFATGTLFDIFTSGYYESYRKIHGIETNRKRNILQNEKYKEKKEEEKRFYNTLYRLRAQKLIEKNETGWKITNKGRQKLSQLIGQRNNAMPVKRYGSEKSDTLTVIIFDIPEKYRKKRIWLRAALIEFGFTLLQKSVWIGYRKVPEEFLHDLKNLEVLKYVEIFSIRKTGTIKIPVLRN